jgi:hypothetical protein
MKLQGRLILLVTLLMAWRAMMERLLKGKLVAPQQQRQLVRFNNFQLLKQEKRWRRRESLLS